MSSVVVDSLLFASLFLAASSYTFVANSLAFFNNSSLAFLIASRSSPSRAFLVLSINSSASFFVRSDPDTPVPSLCSYSVRTDTK